MTRKDNMKDQYSLSSPRPVMNIVNSDDMYYTVQWWDAEEDKWISDGIEYKIKAEASKAARKFKRQNSKLTFRILLNTKLIYLAEEL